MKKIISMLLAVVMVLGLLPITSFATTSDMNVIEPDSWYSILLPQNASDELQNAAEEMNFFLDEITGITLPVVTDDGSATADGCYISIGNTSLFQNSGVSADALEAEASAIKTTGDSILLFGGSDVGATYAVYELLEHWFDLKFYTPDCYTYTAKETVAFEELDMTSTPAVDHRTVGMYLTWYSGWTNLRRMRVSNAEEYMDRLGHSFFTLMPPAAYYGAHPEWFSNYQEGHEDNWQLCLSNQEMRAQLLANVKAQLANQGDRTYFAIVQNDGEGFCTCNNCKTLNLKYSNDATKYAGACLEVVNEIATACKEEYPNVIFYMTAYTKYTCNAPTKNIIAADNVGVMYAPIDCNRTYSYFGNSGTADYTNGIASSCIEGWSEICDHMMMWGYNAQFGDAMVPTNSYDSLKANAEGYAANDFEVVFEQAIGSALPNFETLRNYLTAKALYDGTINTFVEADNFINAYYGPAASAISDYFDAHLANLRAFEAKGNAYKSWAAGQYLNGDYRYSPAIITDNYSKSYVDTCKGYFDAAYAALANAYSADSAAYATYKKRIDLEYFGVLYLYLELYADQLSQEEGAAMVKLAEKIINENSVTAINGQKINSWRNQFNVIPDAIDYTFFENIGDAQSCNFTTYTGVVGGMQVTNGVRITSAVYQPSFKFTESAVGYIKAYAQANGYDVLRIHAYADLHNNALVLNNQLWVGKQWSSLDVDIASLTTAFTFFSGSEGLTDAYLTFEFRKSDLINKNSFTGAGFGFENFEGTVGGKDISGVRALSASYQPTFYFTEAAVAAIKEYAEANNVDTLKINAYAILSNNGFILNGAWIGSSWVTVEIPVADLSTAISFWSQSEGSSDIYLTFEFYKAELINKTSFVGAGWGFENYTGNVGGKDISGVRALSASYQPTFYFTEAAVAAIKEYAAANNVDTLKINAYAIVTNNAFVMNNQVWLGTEWKTLEINVADLSTAISFWSQSEGSSDIYLTFEFYKAELINKNSFTGAGVGFENYTGNVGGKDISGVRALSGAYQPTFYFTEAAIAEIKAYADANGYNAVEIGAYGIFTNNCGVINNALWYGSEWTSMAFSVDAMTTSFPFTSLSEGTTEIYLTFEFVHSHVYDSVVTDPTCTTQGYTTHTCSCGDSYVDSYVDVVAHNYVDGICSVCGAKYVAIKASSFTSSVCGFYDVTENVGGRDISGVRVLSASYQPSFSFTEAAIAEIKAYAEAKGYDTLTISAYAVLTNNAFVVNNQMWVGTQWTSLDVDIASLTTGFTFFSGSEGTSDIYMTFEFYKAELINKSSFVGAGWGFADYTGNIGGQDIVGVHAWSDVYQPTFYFTEAAITKIKAYAAENGYNTLKINAYANLYNNGFICSGTWTGSSWTTTEISVDDLSTSIAFFSQSEGRSDVYLTFEFAHKHIYESVVTAPTCTAQGYTTHTCACGDSYVDSYTDVIAHNYVNDVCDVCGAKYVAIKASSFTSTVCGFYDVTENVGGRDISGVRVLSASYQPTFSFTEAAIAEIKAYAEAKGYDTLTISAYAVLTNNAFVVNNQMWVGTQWTSLDVDIASLTTGFTFFSGSEGTSDIYMTFEFYKAELINKSSFTGAGWGFADYTGNIGGQDIVGVHAWSDAYQPTFYFTEAAIAKIKAYAAENGYNTLKINAYANLYNNGFVFNGVWTAAFWATTEISIDDLSTSIAFWSQSEGRSDVYLTFELYKAELINKTSFTGSGWGFENYTGNIGGQDIVGVHAWSDAYQPTFYFTEAAIAKIKAYAAENGYNTLKINAYANLYNNGFVFNGVWTAAFWATTEISIDDLSTSIAFWSQSEGRSDVYLTFELYKAEVINKSSFTGAGWGFADYTGNIGGQDIVGVHAWSDVYQPTFYFTEAAIAKIKAYATENGYNTLKVNAYANLYNNGFICAGTWTGAAWTTTEISVDSLSTSIAFFSQSEGRSDVYLTFEFAHKHIYSDWVVTTPATLQAAGEQQKTCSCGDVITEVIPCLAGDVESWGLTLGGDLSVNFMLSVHEDIRETAKIVISVNGVATEYAVAELAPNADSGLYYVSVNVAAAQMNDTITVQIVNGEDASVTKEYTVANYAKIILANESYSAYHQIVKEMLNYGDAAQTYFGYNVDNRADVNLEGVGTVEVPADAAADMVVSGKVDGISFYGASLLFRNKIAVRYYFTVTGNISDYTFTANGAEIGYDEKDGLYYIEVADINPQDLDDAITVAVNDTLTVSYSPMNYIVRMSTKDSDNLKALMKALYNYHLAAEIIVPDVV